ncbi:MAG: hypothetical protein HC836_42485 [Richelia sp. RM2_1_2]|nr:hypothetical protein [Richelia sp. SM2_1_7]NJM21762.1 hypothetical protein [Richelia sp. SM1_7_0]NJN12342.1 hypothetical protein [Richelia sp. RM1_1_1]NJO30694.1 hypothetical protein [Richelia sp. SL_2_1]NJO64577.1 hypothetical protein [Richelia sp. RM2_1_2]
MTKDINPYFLAVAGILVALYFFNENTELKQQINSCQLQFEGFKEGVIYGR